MAGASAKKSAAAKASSAKVYQAILALGNVVYAMLYVLLGRAVSVQLALVHLLLLGLQLYAYFGILEDAAAFKPKEGSLVGGANLDLLGAVLVLQYLGGLLNHRFFYLLGLLPLWGGWKMYSLFYGGQTKMREIAKHGVAADETRPEDESAKQPKQRRTGKQRQKWS